jgi:hypothetical protein
LDTLHVEAWRAPCCCVLEQVAVDCDPSVSFQCNVYQLLALPVISLSLEQVVQGKSVEQALRWAAAAEAGLPQEVAGAVQEVLAAQDTPFQGAGQQVQDRHV